MSACATLAVSEECLWAMIAFLIPSFGKEEEHRRQEAALLPKQQPTSSMLKLTVQDDDAPQCVHALKDKVCRTEYTCGDGACAIHSVFGEPSSHGLFLSSARAFLASSWGSTAELFRERVADPTLLHELVVFLWNDVLKPQAKLLAGLDKGQHALGPEAHMIWEQIAKNPQLVQLFSQSVKDESQQYTLLQGRRDELGAK